MIESKLNWNWRSSFPPAEAVAACVQVAPPVPKALKTVSYYHVTST